MKKKHSLVLKRKLLFTILCCFVNFVTQKVSGSKESMSFRFQTRPKVSNNQKSKYYLLCYYQSLRCDQKFQTIKKANFICCAIIKWAGCYCSDTTIFDG